jgi:hypothetical protein
MAAYGKNSMPAAPQGKIYGAALNSTTAKTPENLRCFIGLCARFS